MEVAKLVIDPMLARGSGVNRFVNNDNYYFIPMPYMARYQCLIFFDRIVFSSSTPNGTIKDRYKINNRVREIRQEILQLGLPENTLLLGGLTHDNPDTMAQFFKGQASTAFGVKYETIVQYFIYDILYYDGLSLEKERFEDRRNILEAIFKNESFTYLKMGDIYKGKEEKKKFLKTYKGSVDIFHKDRVFKQPYYRHNNFERYHVLLTKVNYDRGRFLSIDIGMYKRGKLHNVGAIKSLARKIVNKGNFEQYIGKIAIVSSRATGKKLLNPRLVEILKKETDHRKCRFENILQVRERKEYDKEAYFLDKELLKKILIQKFLNKKDVSKEQILIAIKESSVSLALDNKDIAEIVRYMLKRFKNFANEC